MPVGYLLERQRFRSTMIGTSLMVGLFTRPPSGGDAGVELSGNGYARQTTSMLEALNLCAVNAQDVIFTATDLWPVARYFGLYNLEGGLLYWDQLLAPVSIAGGQWVIQSGQLFVDWLNRVSPLPFHAGSGAPATKANVEPEFGRQVVLRLEAEPLPTASAGASVQVGTKWLRKVTTARYVRLVAVADANVGTYLVRKLLDATRATGAGFTVTSPDGLAF